MALTIEQTLQRESELLAQHAALHAERKKLLLSENPNENKLRDLHKKIREAKDALDDAADLRREAEKQEAAARRAISAAEKLAKNKAAHKTTEDEQKAAEALQLVVQAFAKGYAEMRAATAARQAAFRAAGVRYFPAGSLDIMVSREFARCGLQHLSHLNLTGISKEPNISESFVRHMEKARATLDASVPPAEPKTEAAA